MGSVTSALAKLGEPVVSEFNLLVRAKGPDIVSKLRQHEKLLNLLPVELISARASSQQKACAFEFVVGELLKENYAAMQNHRVARAERLGSRASMVMLAARLLDLSRSPSVSVVFDGWVMPKGGVAFVWVLDDEIGSRSLRRR